MLLATVVAYQLWWSQPSAFGGIAGNYTATPRSGKLTTFNMDVDTHSVTEKLTLRGAEPVLTTNTADAHFEFVVCRLRDTDLLPAGSGSLTPWCSDVTPLAGHAVTLNSRYKDVLVMRATFRKPGRVVIHGAKVHYTRDWAHLKQTGDEVGGPDFVIHVQ